MPGGMNGGCSLEEVCLDDAGGERVGSASFGFAPSNFRGRVADFWIQISTLSTAPARFQ